MTTSPLADIGLIGLGVMGSNIALNLNSRDLQVSVFNKTFPGQANLVEAFASAHVDKGFTTSSTLAEFVNTLERPRKIWIMILAGTPVDEMIEELIPLLEEGDIIIDGGNSFYEDSIRRENYLKSNGIHFVGAGVSGGAEGARKGPSIMAGGSTHAQEQTLPIFKLIAANTSNKASCAAWVGPDGAGHFSKMVHNGIEYADMQLISEIYEIMRKPLQLSNTEMAAHFKEWNTTSLQSYLVEITSQILEFKENDEFVVDEILDVAGHKGTGLWTVHEALKKAVAVPTIYAAVNQRLISRHKNERVQAALNINAAPIQAKELLTNDQLANALLLSRIAAYAQGFHLLKEASLTHGWDLKLKELAGIWRAGCIIRSALLEDIMTAFGNKEDLYHLFDDPNIRATCLSCLNDLKTVVKSCASIGIAIPALSSALQYFISWHNGDLPINLIQAQRDFFGAHQYHRKDDPTGPLHHTNWEAK